MRRKGLSALVVSSLALVIVLGAAWKAPAHQAKTPYPNMAPVDQYLMQDGEAEIALARSAAPESISRDAEVMVLGRHGYETAIPGKNGFVCVVERNWMAPFDNLEFWNPKNRSPICYNPQAARSILPVTIKRTEPVMAERSKAQIQQWEKEAYARKELPATVEPGAMAYMMSKRAYLTDKGSHNLAHLMFYTPVMNRANWGADAPNSPVIFLQQVTPEPFTVFLVPTGKWSDGTSAPLPN